MDRLPLTLRLDLSHHCVETEIRKLYNQNLMQYFKKDADRKTLEKTIEILRYALEHFDFRVLRSRHSALAGNSDVEARLLKTDEKQVFLSVEGEVIYP